MTAEISPWRLNASPQPIHAVGESRTCRSRHTGPHPQALPRSRRTRHLTSAFRHPGRRSLTTCGIQGKCRRTLRPREPRELCGWPSGPLFFRLSEARWVNCRSVDFLKHHSGLIYLLIRKKETGTGSVISALRRFAQSRRKCCQPRIAVGHGKSIEQSLIIPANYCSTLQKCHGSPSYATGV